MVKARQITVITESTINPKRYLRFPDMMLKLSDILYNLFTKVTFLFTILLLKPKNRKVISQYPA